MSSYEQRRQRKIERNMAVLASLGLSSGAQQIAAPMPSAPKRRAAKRRRTQRPMPSRPRSKRLRGLNSDGATLPAAFARPTAARFVAVSAAGDTEWADVLFAGLDLELANTARDLDWDRRRCHQHLTISSGGGAVATTGCAGYGGVVATSSRSGPRNAAWAVRCVRVGSGGWAVGVCASKSIGKPYKSLGKHPAALVLHSSGAVHHNRKVHAYAPPSVAIADGEARGEVGGEVEGEAEEDDGDDGAFGEGALVTIATRYAKSKLAAVCFAVDGVERGCVPRAALASLRQALRGGKLELCCQPYKGGAAFIVQHST